MKYMGSKAKHVKYLLPFIAQRRRPGQIYIEPFCGGCNMIEHVANPRIANDLYTPLIEMWQALVYNDWTPPNEISLEEYTTIRQNPQLFPASLVGFVSIGCSYAGKIWGGYARGENRNYCAESKRNVLKQVPNLRGCLFTNYDYKDLTEICLGQLVYCDPPYQNTTGYRNKTDPNDYWDWIRYLSENNTDVLCSEYEAPDDFVRLWEKKVLSSLDLDISSKKNTEKLFIHESRL